MVALRATPRTLCPSSNHMHPQTGRHIPTTQLPPNRTTQYVIHKSSPSSYTNALPPHSIPSCGQPNSDSEPQIHCRPTVHDHKHSSMPRSRHTTIVHDIPRLVKGIRLNPHVTPEALRRLSLHQDPSGPEGTRDFSGLAQSSHAWWYHSQVSRLTTGGQPEDNRRTYRGRPKDAKWPSHSIVGLCPSLLPTWRHALTTLDSWPMQHGTQ